MLRPSTECVRFFVARSDYRLRGEKNLPALSSSCWIGNKLGVSESSFLDEESFFTAINNGGTDPQVLLLLDVYQSTD
ncbi:MAG: hypothetical protein H8E82_01920 [Candidatus Marinimicrobia bacterium]|nr:hypothetical protein [Candidatus Neomarinimicrobiota bacterium]MBL7047773.1 hypothetical protein [Candidatus Neomarinimicrobiota bacterium]